MSKLRTFLSALAVALLIGTAAAAGSVAFDAGTFDAFASDDGYITLVRDGDVLIIGFDEAYDERRGSLPATMEGDALPLDGDFDEDRLTQSDSLGLYGGLPVHTDTWSVTLEVEGDGAAIHQAVLMRLADLGVDAQGGGSGPVFGYALSDGDVSWRLAITPSSSSTLIHLRAN